MSSALPDSGPPTSLEWQVLVKFLEGQEPALAVLRAQLGHLAVTSRESFPTGFYTHFQVAQDVPGLAPPISTQLNDVFVETPTFKHGGGFVLWVAEGYLHMLEGFTFDEPWSEPTSFRLHYFHGDQRDWNDIASRLSGIAAQT